MESKIQQTIEKSVDYLIKHGRPLEKALMEFKFNDGSPNLVIEALRYYQNEDGGFGKALEPDLRCPDSSSLCTTVAFSVMWELDLDNNHPMIEKGIQFLMDTYDKQGKSWFFVPPAADLYPRAPWWNFENDSRASRHNPRPEILGSLLQAQSLVPGELIQEVVEDVEKTFLTERENFQMHDLLSYLRLARCENLPETLEKVLSAELPDIIKKVVAFEPEKWAGYSLRPYQVVRNMNDPLLSCVEGAMHDSLLYLIDEQDEDGSWPLTWNWGESFSEIWPIAEKEWRSVVTFDYLLILKNFSAMVSS